MAIFKKSLFCCVFLGAALAHASELSNTLTPEHSGNWFVNGYIQHESEDAQLNKFGAGFLAGYSFENNVDLYAGVTKHSSNDPNHKPSTSFIVGASIPLRDELFIFSEARQSSLHGPSLTGGAGYHIPLSEGWSFVAKAGYNTKVDLTANIGIRYDYGSTATYQIVRNDSSPKKLLKPQIYSYQLDVKFSHDSSEIVDEQYPKLASLVRRLKADKNITVTIEGHTSLVGTDDYNMALSQRRANAVREYLINYHGILSSRLEAVGYGETEPLMLGETEEAQRVNRRVVATIRYQR